MGVFACQEGGPGDPALAPPAGGYRGAGWMSVYWICDRLGGLGVRYLFAVPEIRVSLPDRVVPVV